MRDAKIVQKRVWNIRHRFLFFSSPNFSEFQKPEICSRRGAGDTQIFEEKVSTNGNYNARQFMSLVSFRIECSEYSNLNTPACHRSALARHSVTRERALLFSAVFHTHTYYYLITPTSSLANTSPVYFSYEYFRFRTSGCTWLVSFVNSSGTPHRLIRHLGKHLPNCSELFIARHVSNANCHDKSERIVFLFSIGARCIFEALKYPEIARF